MSMPNISINLALKMAFELKYLKKEQAHLVSETMEAAKQQILSYYQKDTLLPSKAMLHLLAVVVVKDEVWVEEVVLS